jgi:hypothetical protein
MSIEQLERELGDRIRRTLGEAMPRLETEAAQLARPADAAAGTGHVHIVGVERARGTTERRRAVPWAVAAAAAGVVAISAAVGFRSGAEGDEPIDRVTSPPTTTSPQTEIEPWPDDFANIVDLLLPDGFRVVHASRWPLMAVAYDGDGVRIEVLVDVGGAGLPAEGRSPGLHLSPDGDWVNGSVLYGLDVERQAGDPAPVSMAAAEAALPDVLDGVAGAFTGDVRNEILGATYPVLDSASLRAAIDAAVGERLGGHVANRQFAADFAFEYVDDDVRYSVTVIRSDSALPDGVAEPVPGAMAGLAWANNWQLVVTAIAGNGQPIDREVVSELIATVHPLLDAWRPPAAVSVPICDTYVLKFGDSLVAIADRYGVDEASLRVANPDADVNLLLGSTVQIPCPG